VRRETLMARSPGAVKGNAREGSISDSEDCESGKS
jgi:hypothetical protein